MIHIGIITQHQPQRGLIRTAQIACQNQHWLRALFNGQRGTSPAGGLLGRLAVQLDHDHSNGAKPRRIRQTHSSALGQTIKRLACNKPVQRFAGQCIHFARTGIELGISANKNGNRAVEIRYLVQIGRAICEISQCSHVKGGP